MFIFKYFHFSIYKNHNIRVVAVNILIIDILNQL